MAPIAFADELASDERARLLSDPYSEVHCTESGRELIKYYALNIKQLSWLSRELGYKPWHDTLYNVLEAISTNQPVYSTHFKRKRSGGLRRILAPVDSLKEVQRKILDNILVLYPVSPCAFGYSGGSIFDAIRPHIEAGGKSLFSTDIRDAFPSVQFEDIFERLYGMSLNRSYKGYVDKSYLSWGVAFSLCRVMTCGRSLPQGAPSSPRLFDMVFLPLDQRLERLARRVGGTYTRFADNIYFSFPQEDFPGAIARAIIRIIHENKHVEHCGLSYAKRFQCHKTSIRPLGEEAIRILGVNVASSEIRPTRQFKRRIRLSLYRMSWLLANTPYDVEAITKCWQIVQGQVSFANQTILSDSLREQYETVKDALERMLSLGEAPVIS